ASFRLLDERLVITGGVTDRTVFTGGFSEFNVIGSTNVARDVEALYLLKKDGSLVLRASNKLNNENLLSPGPGNDAEYVSAVGLVYRKDFDSFKELLSF